MDLITDLGLPDAVDSYFGIAFGVLHAIAKISSLSMDVQGLDAGRSDLGPFPTAASRQEALEVERSLHCWTPTQTHDHEIVAMALAYRSAALAYLYSRARDKFATHVVHHKIQAEVAQIFQEVANIPLGAYTDGSLLFPLFIAGTASSDVLQQEAIRTRMQYILHHRGFRNVTLALEVLEVLWMNHAACSNTSQSSPKWTEILDIAGPGLNLS